MNLATINNDTRCLIFSKINSLKEIKNIIRAYPQFAKQLYSCLLLIEEKNGENEIIPAEIVLRMTNLQSINIGILVNDENELVKLANRNFDYLHLILSENFGVEYKGYNYLKFTQYVDKFVRLWSKNKLDEEEEFFEVPSSPILNKTLIIERFKDEEIDYDNDKGIRFIYDQGIIEIYKNNVNNIKARKIFLDLIEYLDRHNNITGLEVFTKFITVPGATEETIDPYFDLFGYVLDGLKTVGLSYQTESDVGFWIVAAGESKQLSKIYHIPTTNPYIPLKLLSRSTVVEFEGMILDTIDQMQPNNKITNLELPISLKQPNIIPLVLQKFPNIRVIGVRAGAMKREDRIQQIRHISTTYPQFEFIVFVGKDPPEPKLPNIEYRSLSLDYNID